MDYMTALDTLTEIAQAVPKRNLWRVEQRILGPLRRRLPDLEAGSILELKGFRYRRSQIIWRFEVVSSTSLPPRHRIRVTSTTVRTRMRPIEVED